MSSHNVMIDIETLGNSADSVVLSIGAVAIVDSKIVGRFYVCIDIQSCLDRGFVVDGSTIAWWFKQSEEARKAHYDNEDTSVPIKQALLRLADWFDDLELGEALVWGNGSDFDNAILSTAYKKCGLIPSWKFWNNRCYRTIKNLYPKIKIKRIGNHHNALDDAESQGLHLIKILKCMEGI